MLSDRCPVCHVLSIVLAYCAHLQLHPTQFSAHVHCRQTAGWMKTPLGTEVDLGPDHTVLDGDLAPPRKEHSSPPLFSAHVYSIVTTVAHLSYC